MHPDQAQNTSSGIQGQEATAVAVIYVTWSDENHIRSLSGLFAVDCIALNCSGKHKRKMVIRDIKQKGNQQQCRSLDEFNPLISGCTIII